MDGEFRQFYQKNQERLLYTLKEMVVIRHMDDMEKVMKILAEDPHLLKLFSDQQSSIDTLQKWDNIRLLFPERAWVYFGSPENEILVSPYWEADDTYDLRLRPWYINALEADGEIAWSDPFIEYVTHETVLTCSIAVYDDQGDLSGVLAIDTFLNQFIELFKVGFKEVKETLLLVDQSGKVLLENKSDYMGIETLTTGYIGESGLEYLHWKGETFLLTRVPIESLDWDIVSLLPVSRIQNDVKKLEYFIILLLGLSIIMALAAAYILSSYVIRNIRILNRYMERIMLGNYSLEICVEHKNEFLLMNHQLNDMTRRLSGSIDIVQTLMRLLTHSIRNSLISMDYRILDLVQRKDFPDRFKEDLLGLDKDIHSIQRYILNCTLGQEEHLEKFFNHQESCSLMDLLDISIDRVSRVAEHRKVQILMFNPLTNTLVKGSSLLLQHCLENVLVNAIDASLAGSDIEIFLSQEKGSVCIYIGDHGRGIPEEMKDKLFTLPGDTEPKQQEETHGLGLAVTRKVLKSCSGSIKLVEREEFSTCFRICLKRISPS